MEFRGSTTTCSPMHFTVEIETKWNLEYKLIIKGTKANVVEIETKWNLEAPSEGETSGFMLVEIETKWNLELMRNI